ncbi:OmpH family outer membrane protein [Granulicella cerasi]|uniref:OmpH family outer membrane protein n=1 Tax=Granulicella cerasi TaxID=741063 RepID=A0ABW1ZAG9_9BACT|nr:OmpH family outer membrane protein [Granulicella cerasi]
MNRKLVFALAAGLATSSFAFAQAPAAAPAVAPEALPAKVAIIAFEQAVVATNEGQKAFADIQKKYEPKKNAIEAQGAEVDSLKKQLQALPATTSDEERASRIKAIDTKEKSLQRDAEDAQNAYQGDIQEALGKISQKVGGAAVDYAKKNGFTLLLNVGGNQQTPNPVLWFAEPTDITQAVVNAYNTTSGIAAPAPSAPSPRRTAPAAAKPATAAPKK